MPEQDKDPFYVGYLPLPVSIKRFIVPWLVGNCVLAIGIAAVFASNHREPGKGIWENSEAVTIEGYLKLDPYPMLVAEDGTYLLVEQGKLGAQVRTKAALDTLSVPRDGASANVTGFRIEREGRKILEIDPLAENPIAFTSGALYSTPGPSDLGTHTLTGEIVDPKCYLGVMQPGDGKTHKTCATLCIKGGIPPMLLVRDKQGNTAAYLLTDQDGNPMPESIHPYIADPIELTGQVLRDGDLLMLRADFSTIRRLKAGS